MWKFGKRFYTPHNHSLTKKQENCKGNICVSLSSFLGKFKGNSISKLDYVKSIFENGQMSLDKEWVDAMAPIFIDARLKK